MDENALLSCRGCLTKVSNKSQHSFQQPDIKELFMECTAIQIPPDDLNRPQQICSECWSKCEQWYAFKNMCHISNEHLLNPTASPATCVDDHDMAEGQIPMDGNDEQDELELVVDSEEEDLEDISIVDLTLDNSTDFDCPVCKAVLPESVHLRNHLKEHYSDKDPKCPICAETFTRGSKVYAHVIAVHMEGDSKTVPVCPKEKPLTKHSSGKSSGTMHSCHICKEQCLELRNHIMDTHVPSGTRTCPICSRLFGTRADLSRHLLVHTKEKPFGCNKCHVRFTQKGNVFKHIRKFHTDKPVEKGFVVKEGSIFHNINPWEEMGYSLDVNHHGGPDKQASKQPKDKPSSTQCSVCKKVFESRYQLHLHSVIHTGERPYKCTYCEEDFQQKAIGIVHVLNSHPNEIQDKAIVLNKDTEFTRKLRTLGSDDSSGQSNTISNQHKGGNP